MADIGELTSYIESNPNDHEQRWHLAKKLYMAGEYHSALGHMLVLQTNWTPKVNVLRYLAATYYRLGRYDEAITELKGGIEEWPDEIPLREQLARVLEVSGKYEEAIATWEGILKRNPSNSMAKRLLEKLQEAKPGQKLEPQGAQDPGFIGSVGKSCPTCGAQNSEEFDRCWKCHSPLDAYGMPHVEMASPVESKPAVSGGFPVTDVVCGAAVVGLLALGIYLSMQHFTIVRDLRENPKTLCTVREILDASLVSTKVATGVVLLFVWPAVLWLGGLLMQPGGQARKPFLVGALMASFGYLFLWRAPGEIAYAFTGVVVLAIVPIVAVMRLRIVPAISVWLIQAAVVLCTVPACVAALEGTTFLQEFFTIMRYAQVHDAVRNYGGEPGRHIMSSLYIPVDMNVVWESTNSTWLDKKATRADFALSGDAQIPGLTVEIKDPNGGTLIYEHVTSLPYKFTFDKITPGVTQKFIVTGQANAKLDVTVRGLLNLRIEN